MKNLLTVFAKGSWMIAALLGSMASRADIVVGEWNPLVCRPYDQNFAVGEFRLTVAVVGKASTGYRYGIRPTAEWRPYNEIKPLISAAYRGKGKQESSFQIELAPFGFGLEQSGSGNFITLKSDGNNLLRVKNIDQTVEIEDLIVSVNSHRPEVQLRGAGLRVTSASSGQTITMRVSELNCVTAQDAQRHYRGLPRKRLLIADDSIIRCHEQAPNGSDSCVEARIAENRKAQAEMADLFNPTALAMQLCKPNERHVCLDRFSQWAALATGARSSTDEGDLFQDECQSGGTPGTNASTCVARGHRD